MTATKTGVSGAADRSHSGSVATRSLKALTVHCLPWQPAAGSDSAAVAGTCSAQCLRWPAGAPLVTLPERHRTGYTQLSQCSRSVLVNAKIQSLVNRCGSEQSIVFPENYARGPGRSRCGVKGQRLCWGLGAKPLEAVAVCHFKSTKCPFRCM